MTEVLPREVASTYNANVPINFCACEWVDLGQGYQRVANEPGCPVHFPLPSVLPYDPQEYTETQLMEAIGVEMRKRQVCEERFEMMKLRLQHLQHELEGMAGATHHWVAREVATILQSA